jgi:hypothetical protein
MSSVFFRRCIEYKWVVHLIAYNIHFLQRKVIAYDINASVFIALLTAKGLFAKVQSDHESSVKSGSADLQNGQIEIKRFCNA